MIFMLICAPEGAALAAKRKMMTSLFWRRKMSETLPVIRHTGLSAYVEAYAKESWAYPIMSLFGSKTSVQAIASALVSRKPEVYIIHESDEIYGRRDVWLTPGNYRIFSRTLRCGAHHLLVINTHALLKHCTLPSFYLVSRPGEDGKIASCYFSFLDRLVPVPLLNTWSGWLWKRGIEKGEIDPLEGFRLATWECRVDMDDLKKDLSQAIKKRHLSLKENENETGRKSQGRVLSHPVISS